MNEAAEDLQLGLDLLRRRARAGGVGVAILIRAAWDTSTIAGVLPVAVWVALRAVLGLYPGYGINAVDELRRQSYATLGALIIASTFLGLHQGQDVSRSVLIRGFWHS